MSLHNAQSVSTGALLYCTRAVLAAFRQLAVYTRYDAGPTPWLTCVLRSGPSEQIVVETTRDRRVEQVPVLHQPTFYEDCSQLNLGTLDGNVTYVLQAAVFKLVAKYGGPAIAAVPS